MLRFIACFLCLASSLIVWAQFTGQEVPNGQVVEYIESHEDFPNPERGFYRYTSTNTSEFVSLDAETLRSYRTLQTPGRAMYSVASTLIFRYYTLDNFVNHPLSGDVIRLLYKDMEAARDAGVKIIPRFVYTTRSNKGDCPEGFICPPYGDAPKDIVLGHISQLKPLFHDNADVIACVQLGFIGTWGEQYYTDYFGDASSNGEQGGKLLDINWQDRIDILKALLAAVPESRMVQVRYPQFKQKFVHGVSAAPDAVPIAIAEAFTGTDEARIGLHNDCFLSGRNDVGTYEDYGDDRRGRNSSEEVVRTLREYMENEGKYVVVGGETCRDAYDPQNNCEPDGFALAEFRTMRYSFLNAHYNNEVNNDWQEGGCMDSIKLNLGYRFVLSQSVFPQQVKTGERFAFSIRLINRGFSSPYNSRPVTLVFRNADNGTLYHQRIDTQIQRWQPGDIELKQLIMLPRSLKRGRYEILINMPDHYESIAGNPDYSIRLANEKTWEASTGYNKLHQIIEVN